MLLRRDLGIVFRARTTWWLALVSTLLVGHGFVRALERVRAGDGGGRALDPMLRGLYVALCICGPVVAARALSREKERRTFHALLLQVPSLSRVVLSKWLSGTLGVFLPWIALPVLLGLWRMTMGDIGLPAAYVTLVGYAFYSGYVAAVGVAAASLAGSFRGAVFLAWLTIGWNAAIDVSDSVEMLAWMQSNRVWSPATHLASFEHGQLALGSVTWLCAAISTWFTFGWIGCRFDLRGTRRWAAFALATVICAPACLLAREVPGSWDLVVTVPEPRTSVSTASLL
jgi:hypothetical protein